MTVNYPNADDVPGMKNGCWTYRGVDGLISWCGDQIKATSLGEKTTQPERNPVEIIGWFGQACAEVPDMDAVWRNMDAECLQLNWKHHTHCDCKNWTIGCIEELSVPKT